MRNIKFRGKVSKGYNENFFKQKFVYGSAIICEDNISSTIINNEFEAEVDTNTIGQFTGLKDKNGKEIYEGDICSTYNIDEPSNLVDIVVFDEGSFVFQNDYKLSAELRGFKTDYIEVIGNIYEPPELNGK